MRISFLSDKLNDSEHKDEEKNRLRLIFNNIMQKSPFMGNILAFPLNLITTQSYCCKYVSNIWNINWNMGTQPGTDPTPIQDEIVQK